MTVDELQAENARLRAELDAIRQKEVEDLRTRCAAAEAARDLYLSEARRHEQLVRDTVSEANQKITALVQQISSRDSSAITEITKQNSERISGLTNPRRN